MKASGTKFYFRFRSEVKKKRKIENKKNRIPTGLPEILKNPTETSLLYYIIRLSFATSQKKKKISYYNSFFRCDCSTNTITLVRALHCILKRNYRQEVCHKVNHAEGECMPDETKIDLVSLGHSLGFRAWRLDHFHFRFSRFVASRL